jgi:hypothetical protein
MLPPIALALWFKSSFDRLMCWFLVLYALRYKDNVAAKYANGTFELVATGVATKKLE